MATVCGATLGMMSAGVPCESIAGISIGLVKKEDGVYYHHGHYGRQATTAIWTSKSRARKRRYGIQLDLKINGISKRSSRKLKQAREARIRILRRSQARREPGEKSPYMRRASHKSIPTRSVS